MNTQYEPIHQFSLLTNFICTSSYSHHITSDPADNVKLMVVFLLNKTYKVSVFLDIHHLDQMDFLVIAKYWQLKESLLQKWLNISMGIKDALITLTQLYIFRMRVIETNS